MCLITFAWQAHPHHDLIVAANRDEYHQRPTQAAHGWPDAPGVFAGRDQQAGGAWCGVGPNGRFAAVTNVRDPDPPVAGRASRGTLVADYLAGGQPARGYCEAVQANGDAYGGFNLLVGDRSSLFYVGNRDKRGIREIPPGVYALSNGVWGDVWPKTRAAEAGLRAAITTPVVPMASLLDLLADDTPADNGLPDTGLGADVERFLSPIFVRGLEYGTRASTVILRQSNGGLTMLEQGYGPDGAVGNRIEQSWEAA